MSKNASEQARKEAEAASEVVAAAPVVAVVPEVVAVVPSGTMAVLISMVGEARAREMLGVK